MKKLLLLLGAGAFFATANAQTARIQAIHNSADAATANVDVWLTTPTGSSLLLDDFQFRNASPFIDAPAGVPIKISFAASTSTMITDTIPGLSFDYNLVANETYILVAEGIISATGYSPATAFDIAVYGMGQESAVTAGNTDVLVHHGATDAPAVDVYESSVPAGNIVTNAAYGDFTSYINLATADYTLEVRPTGTTTAVAAYEAPLATLGLQDSAIIVVASGFLDPSVNSNGPAFGLWVALPEGGALVELPLVVSPTARVQVIHNSADAAATTVDVYLDGALLLDDFAFRTASPFIDAPAGSAIAIDIAPSNSTSVANSIATFNYTLTANETYVLVAEGIVSATGYSPATAFDIAVYGMGQEAAITAGNTDVLVHHGATDAPAVDVYESSVPAGNIVTNAAYGDFTSYINLATADYTLEVRPTGTATAVAAYEAPLAALGLEDSAIVVVASGFLDPSVNSNGSAFGLWVALPEGGALVELPVATPTGLSAFDTQNINLKAFPNPARNTLNIEGLDLSSVNVTITSILGKQIQNSVYTVNDDGINISGLAKGTYQIVLSNDNNIIGQSKFVKY